MHIAAVSTLFFAALAAADSHGHARRFHHRRALNETMTTAVTSAQAPLTTLTVQTTVMSTIYNCGKNITETTCDGAHATDAVTVTQVIDLTTTVCPVADASSISKSVIASATIPASVDAQPTPIESASDNSPKPTTSDQVLTYTLGPEGSKTVVTTTIKNTKTASEYTTKTMTYDESSPEQTTTLSSTTTSTRFVTVPAGPEATPGSGSPGAGTDTNVKTPISGEEGNSPSGGETPVEGETPLQGETPVEGSEGNSPSGGSEEQGDCPAPVTVTVAATTVYVTVMPEGTQAPVIPETNENNGSNGGEVVDNAPAPAAPAVTPAPAPAAPVEEEEEGPKSTIFVIPTQKYSNNTMPASTQGAPAPSGFLTRSRPEGTGSVIEPAPTGGLFY